MIDGTRATGTIRSTRIDALPTGTMFIELAVACEIEGNTILVPVKLFVTDKSADRTAGNLRRLGFTDMANIHVLNTGHESPLAGKDIEIELKEHPKYGIQGDIPAASGMNEERIATMAKMLQGAGGRRRAGGDDSDIPF